MISFILSGCWNYRGMDEMEAVMGVAIDKVEGSKDYLLTFETVDLTKSSGPEGEISPLCLESQGTTVFDAIRKAKKRLGNKLYFSHIQVVIINEQIAREEGVEHIVDWFIRDAEPRELLNVIVSQDKTAKELFTGAPLSASFVSQEIKQIIEEDSKSLSAIKDMPMYEMYCALNGKTTAMLLPIFRNVKSFGEETFEANGSAVFKKDKMVGYISSEETHYSLFVTDEVEGGVLTADYDNDGLDDISLEISSSKTKKTYSFKDDQVKVNIDVKIKTYSGELPPDGDPLKKEFLYKVESAAEKRLKKMIENTIWRVQKVYCADIFGIDEMIYKKDHKLWEKISKDWDKYFKDMETQVKIDIDIKNAATAK